MKTQIIKKRCLLTWQPLSWLELMGVDGSWREPPVSSRQLPSVPSAQLFVCVHTHTHTAPVSSRQLPSALINSLYAHTHTHTHLPSVPINSRQLPSAQLFLYVHTHTHTQLPSAPVSSHQLCLPVHTHTSTHSCVLPGAAVCTHTHTQLPSAPVSSAATRSGGNACFWNNLFKIFWLQHVREEHCFSHIYEYKKNICIYIYIAQ